MPVLLATNKKILDKYLDGNYTPNPNWFNVADVDDNSAEIFIYDEISYYGIMAEDIVNQMKGLDVDEINLHINSPGGFVFDGIAIYNLFKSHKAKVNVYIDSLAASIASIIAMAGDKVYMADNAQIMIHDPLSFVFGNATELRKEAVVLDNIKETLVSTYAHRSSASREELSDLMTEESWFLPERSLELGLVDEVVEGSKAVASLSPQIISGFLNISNEFKKQISPENPTSRSDSHISGKPVGTPINLAKAKLAYLNAKIK